MDSKRDLCAFWPDPQNGKLANLDAVPCTRRKTGHSFQPNAEPVVYGYIECPQEIHEH